MKTLTFLGLCLLVPALRAQVLPPGSGFDWEQVGDFPTQARALAFGPDSLSRPDALLWASTSEGLLHLDTTAEPPGTWVVANDRYYPEYILPLSADTLLFALIRLVRSTDGGRTLVTVAEPNPTPFLSLAEVPPGAPHAGRLIAGADGNYQLSEGARYSDDRGATWTPSAVPEFGGADDLVVLPAGGPYAGHVVTATHSRGSMYSTDGGASFQESSLWGPLYRGDFVGLVEGPGGGVRLLLVNTTGGASWQSRVSDDGGATWRETALETGAGPRALAVLGGGTAFVLEFNGTVHRTDDGGETWSAVGRAPEVGDSSVFASTAAVGPDGRLYVGLGRAGPQRTWVWRTEPLTAVSSEPGPEPEGDGLGLEVRPNPARGAAEVSFTLARPSAVEVALYDAAGREVAVVVSGRYGAGTHAVTVGAGLAAGVYVVRVVAGGVVASRRFAVLGE